MKSIKNVKNKFCQIDYDFIKSLKVNDYDGIASVYDETMGEDFSRIIFNSHKRIIEKTFPKKNDLRCLDIACGTGSFIRKWAKYKKSAQCFGIDLSKGQIAMANKKAKEGGVVVDFSVGDAVRATFPAKCDVVTINLDALNHIKDPKDWSKIFSKIHASLNTGGLFLFDINTPKRLLEDLLHPEILVKRDITYVQCGVRTGHIDDFALNQHLMQIFQKDKTGIKEYFALIQQIAPSKQKLFSMIKEVGFSKVTEIKYSQKDRDKHIFMKNRLFVECHK